MSVPFVSVVIPVWRDVAGAAVAADSASGGDVEIIFAAAWEDADAVRTHGKAGERVRWLFARRGRGNQMNVGAAAASGEWLLFLHADSVLPEGWLHEMRTASEKGYAAGCFRPGLDADKVDGSAEAYGLLSVGDAFLGFVSYGVTMLLAAMGGAKRHESHPYVPLAMAGKAVLDAGQAAKLTVDQWRLHRAFCSWCLTAAAATFMVVPLVLPEARAALKQLRTRL